MQKLIWTNANGYSVDLTSGHYGITNWEGFSNTSLNIQSQQVPFQDGGVFLDALMEQRELTVTLAMNDEGNLETRYRLRRELIHILNPKLGEGYLIYTNDFISKRIKCVAQVPLFENHNSNDSGTPKASLAWTACEPYWEDLEEITVPLVVGERKTIVNNGDVACGVNIDLHTINVTNPQIKNFTEDKTIKLNGSFQNNIDINTNFGQKTIKTEEMIFNMTNYGGRNRTIIYVDTLGLFVAGGDTILTSPDGINWTKRGGSFPQIYTLMYSEKLQQIFAITTSTIYYTSPDGINWTSHSFGDANSTRTIIYSNSLDLFVCGGGGIKTSPDGINWTNRSVPSNIGLVNTIIYANSLGIFVGVCNNGGIITSPNGINWTSRTSHISTNIHSVAYSESLGLLVADGAGGVILTSPDGINWTNRNSGVGYDLYGVMFSFNNFIIVGYNGTILTSPDGINWTNRNSGVLNNLRWVTYSVILGFFITVGDAGVVLTSENGFEWEVNSGLYATSFNLDSVCYSNDKNMFVSVGSTVDEVGIIIGSQDGVSWTLNSVISDTHYIYEVIYSKKLAMFIAVGSTSVNTNNAGLVLTSPDGINWTKNLIKDSTEIRGITYSNTLGLFVAVGSTIQGTSTVGIIFTSSDGINWRIIDNPTYALWGVTFSESLGLFVAVGSNDILVSSDGSTWFLSESSSKILYNVIYVESLGLFVAVGEESGGIILTSPDGTNWATRKTSNNRNYDVTYSESLGLFIAVGNTVLTSINGVSWNELPSVSGRSIIYSNKYDIFIIVGQNSVIYVSDYAQSENLISSLSTNSDMTFSLEVGENELLLNRSDGEISGTIRYRQKYIGV